MLLPVYVGTLIRKLSNALHEAQEANAAKSLFLASVSHELRTPLTAIIGVSDLLQDTRQDQEQMEMTHIVGSSGRALLRLINSLLDFSRGQIGQVPLEVAQVDLHGVLAETRDMLAVQARAKGIGLHLFIAASTPRHALLSQRHLQEALINLASNAIKFTQSGFVLITAAALPGADKVSRLAFEVIDTGIGIEPADQARIFEAFAQADASIIDRFGGTGLGLAIAKQLVEAQNGRIGVISALGEGSTFWFEIDAGVVVGESAVYPVPSEITPVNLIPAGQTALLVSNDYRLAEHIEQLGIRVRILGRGAEACAALRTLLDASQTRPFLFLDHRLLGDDIETLAAELVNLDINRKPRLVAIAGGDDVDILTATGRRFFTTCLPRTLTQEGVANALFAFAGSSQGRRRADRALKGLHAQRNVRILLAEDNQTNQKVIARILERAGHSVHIVSNGEQALDALERQAFQIVLMDVNMPVMNGVEATKLYRFATLGRQHVPIVALTADATPAGRQRCLEAGMADCLMKPVESERLLTVIDAIALDASNLVEIAAALAHGPENGEAGWPPVSASAGTDLELLSSIGGSALDTRALDDLEALGGREFVDEIVTQFSSDASTVLKSLANALATGDLGMFHDSTHALRSCAANVGAKSIFSTCLAWRDVSQDEFSAGGAAWLAKLGSELEEAQAALSNYLVLRDRIGDRRIVPSPAARKVS